MQKGLNLQNIKQVNRSSVLYLLNKYGMLSRKQITKHLGLTKAAVTKITSELISEGVIEEKESIGNGVGRKEVLLDLKFDNSKVFGITFDRNYITFSISDLKGNLEDIQNISFNKDFSVVKDKIKNYYNGIKSKFNLIGVGVSIIGFQNDYGAFKDIDFEKQLKEFINLPIYVKNNVQAFSQAEIIYGDKTSEKNVLVFKWGPGIGSSFIRDEKVLSGDDFGITEIGHVIVKPNGKPCRCGRKGCLETETALDVIVNDINSLGYNLTIDEILDSNDSKITNLLDEKINMVCLALLNAATILNSNHIVLFGSVFKSSTFLTRFSKKWKEISSPLQVTMVLSNLNDKASYIGSTAMVARKMFFEK